MLEMETDLSGYNMLTGENVSASVSRQDLSMSTTESFNGEFFNCVKSFKAFNAVLVLFSKLLL